MYFFCLVEEKNGKKRGRVGKFLKHNYLKMSEKVKMIKPGDAQIIKQRGMVEEFEGKKRKGKGTYHNESLILTKY